MPLYLHVSTRPGDWEWQHEPHWNNALAAKERQVMSLGDNLLLVARENLEGLNYTEQVTDWDQAVSRVREMVRAMEHAAMQYLLDNPPEVTGVHPSLVGNQRLVSGDYPLNPNKYKRKSIPGKKPASKAIKKKPVAAKKKVASESMAAQKKPKLALKSTAAQKKPSAKSMAPQKKPASNSRAAQKKLVGTSIFGKKASTTATLKKPSASIPINKIFVPQQVSVKKEPISA